MNTLVSCPHCAHQIHESASSCPQCGAVRKASRTGGAAYSTYAQVPWYRKRWFAIVSVLLFMPLYLVIAFTGDVYFVKNEKLQTLPSKNKFIVLGIFVVLVLLQLRTP
jgi:uncharacterized membrane protein YvbJ